MEGLMCSLPLFFVLFCETGSLTEPKACTSVRLADQRNPRICQFLFPQCQGHRCLPATTPSFYILPGTQGQVLMFTKQALHSLNPLQPSSLPLTSTVFTFQDCAGVDFSRETWGILRLDVTPSTMCCHGGQSKLSLRASVPWNKMGSLHGHHPKGS